MPITYFISQVHRLLRETLTAPPIPQACPEHSRRVTLGRTLSWPKNVIHPEFRPSTPITRKGNTS